MSFCDQVVLLLQNTLVSWGSVVPAVDSPTNPQNEVIKLLRLLCSQAGGIVPSSSGNFQDEVIELLRSLLTGLGGSPATMVSPFEDEVIRLGRLIIAAVGGDIPTIDSPTNFQHELIKLLIGLSTTSLTPAEVETYLTRVAADGGLVAEESRVATIISTLQAANLWDALVCCFSASAGRKLSGSSYQKLYCLKSSSNDATVPGGVTAPTYDATGFNGKPAIVSTAASGMTHNSPGSGTAFHSFVAFQHVSASGQNARLFSTVGANDIGMMITAKSDNDNWGSFYFGSTHLRSGSTLVPGNDYILSMGDVTDGQARSFYENNVFLSTYSPGCGGDAGLYTPPGQLLMGTPVKAGEFYSFNRGLTNAERLIINNLINDYYSIY